MKKRYAMPNEYIHNKIIDEFLSSDADLKIKQTLETIASVQRDYLRLQIMKMIPGLICLK